MCQAMALGADKNWENTSDFDRTSLHQAILSVSFYFVVVQESF